MDGDQTHVGLGHSSELEQDQSGVEKSVQYSGVDQSEQGLSINNPLETTQDEEALFRDFMEEAQSFTEDPSFVVPGIEEVEADNMKLTSFKVDVAYFPPNEDGNEENKTLKTKAKNTPTEKKKSSKKRKNGKLRGFSIFPMIFPPNRPISMDDVDKGGTETKPFSFKDFGGDDVSFYFRDEGETLLCKFMVNPSLFPPSRGKAKPRTVNMKEGLLRYFKVDPFVYPPPRPISVFD